MQRLYRYFAALLLGATLIAPVGIQAANPQDRDREQREQRQRARRYYDREHKDYHNWDGNEDNAYRRWITEERHEQYRDFGRLKRDQQSAYWSWRHQHPDNDRDRH